MTTNTKIAIIISIAIVFSTAIFSIVKSRSQQEARLLEMKKYNSQLQLKAERDRSLFMCDATAINNHLEAWDRDCIRLGLDYSCALPTKIATNRQKIIKEARDRCIKVFGN